MHLSKRIALPNSFGEKFLGHSATFYDCVRMQADPECSERKIVYDTRSAAVLLREWLRSAYAASDLFGPALRNAS
jgi:hypothetical protein